MAREWVQVQRWKERARLLKRQTYALYLAYGDPRTPWYARAFAALVVAYALSPIDLIPDFIPVLGMLDDLLLVPLGIALAVRMIPAPVLADSRRRTETAMAHGRPGGWLAAVAIVVVWLLLAALAVLLLARAVGQ